MLKHFFTFGLLLLFSWTAYATGEQSNMRIMTSNKKIVLNCSVVAPTNNSSFGFRPTPGVKFTLTDNPGIKGLYLTSNQSTLNFRLTAEKTPEDRNPNNFDITVVNQSNDPITINCTCQSGC